jgi:hypothetical protein
MAVTFQAEDGTGRDDATSFLEIAELVQIAEDYGYDISTLTTDDLKKQYCNRYSQLLDQKYTWPGVIKISTQSLSWPRKEAYDINDNLIDDDSVPADIKRAVVIMIKTAIAGTDLAPVQDVNGAVKRLRDEVVGAVVTEREYASTGATVPRIPELENALKKILGSTTGNGIGVGVIR